MTLARKRNGSIPCVKCWSLPLAPCYMGRFCFYLSRFRDVALKREYLSSGMGSITETSTKITRDLTSLAFYFSHTMPRQLNLPFMGKTIEEAWSHLSHPVWEQECGGKSPEGQSWAPFPIWSLFPPHPRRPAVQSWARQCSNVEGECESACLRWTWLCGLSNQSCTGSKSVKKKSHDFRLNTVHSLYGIETG